MHNSPCSSPAPSIAALMSSRAIGLLCSRLSALCPILREQNAIRTDRVALLPKLLEREMVYCQLWWKVDKNFRPVATRHLDKLELA